MNESLAISAGAIFMEGSELLMDGSISFISNSAHSGGEKERRRCVAGLFFRKACCTDV